MQAAGSGGTTSSYSPDGDGGDTKLRLGGMKTYSSTHQGARPDSLQEDLHDRGRGFYVAGACVCCRVVSNTSCVLSDYASTLPRTSASCRLLVKFTPGTYSKTVAASQQNYSCTVRTVLLILLLRTYLLSY